MRLYHVSSEKADRWVIGRNANNAREIAIKDGIGGHKIARIVWRTTDDYIPDFDQDPGVISESQATKLVNAIGYNLDGSGAEKPKKRKRGRPMKISADGRKVCLRCKEEKDISCFAPRSGGGYQSYCRDCKKIIDRENRLKRKSGGK